MGGAVQRNFAKRRIRSAIHCLLPEMNQGYDLVLIARKPILDLQYELLVDSLRSLLDRARLLKDDVG